MSLWEVRRGATRVVILTKNYALKVPTFESWELFLCGLLSNMSEVVWNVIECENLCPVIWSIPGGFLNVMPRVETFDTYLETDAYMELFGEREDYTLTFVENKPNHFGYYKNNIVAVDYGQPFVTFTKNGGPSPWQ